MCYKIWYILWNLEWYRLFLIPEYVLSLVEMIELDCDPEELIYDILSYCDLHKCSIENIIKNDVASIFHVTGFINSFVALFFSDFTS